MSFTQFPVTGVLKVPNVAALPISAEQGDIAVALDSSIMYEYFNGSWIVLINEAGLGTVSSVGLALPAGIFSVSGSPVTTTGTLTGSLITQTANTVLAGPASAGPTAPSFRALVLADLPTISIAKGGTGQTSKGAAFDALSPMTTGGDLIYGGASGTGTRLPNGTAGQILVSAGTTLAPVWTTPSASGANQSLSNLTNPTAVNQDLIPGASLNLGTAASQWTTGYIGVLNDSSDVPSVNTNARFLFDGSGVPSVKYNSRVLADSAGVTSVSYDERVLKNDSNIATVDYKRSQLVQNTTPIIDWSDSSKVNIELPILLPQLSADPTGVEGLIYYNTTLHTIRWYNGTSWASLL